MAVTHGNGLLGTILPEDGVLRVDESAVLPDGSIVTKFVWWRRPLEVVQTTVAGVETFTTQFAGELVIAGTLVGSGESLTATTREEGGHVGSTVRFPDGGCWHITGTAGEDALSFTVFVLPPGEPLPSTSMPPLANPMLAIGSMALVLATAAAVRSAWGPNTVTRVRARP